MTLRALQTFAVLGALAGCSFKLAKPPPPPDEWPPHPIPPGAREERCTPSLLPPVFDTAAVVLLGGLAFIERNSSGRGSLILLGAALPVGASAVYGYGSAVACRRYLRWIAPPSP
jgi:hypothetical protein